MRKFTLSVAAMLLTASAFATTPNVTVDHRADQQKVYVTFNDYSAVMPCTFTGNVTGSATLNEDVVTFSIYPLIDETEDLTNTIYFDYMLYFPALLNGGALPDGDYTLTFSENYLIYDYASANEEPVTVNFTVGNTVGISNVMDNASATTYNLQGQKINAANGISIVNGKKVVVSK